MTMFSQNKARVRLSCRLVSSSVNSKFKFANISKSKMMMLVIAEMMTTMAIISPEWDQDDEDGHNHDDNDENDNYFT